MSGLIGLFGRQQGIRTDHVNAMLKSIDHRGPHGSGSWHDSRLGLGYQQLQSTPESTYDDQPIRDGDVVAIVDARIDNREELLNSLALSTEPSRLPDSELVIASYLRWGTDCVDHLLGAFSFAIWDATEDQLFCARDHMGVKPIYYHLSDDQFIIASEIKAILQHPSVPQTLNETTLGEYLSDSFVDKESTYYEAVRRLPPAHAMCVGPEQVERWQYWDLDPTKTLDLPSDEAYERRFRELFKEAVRCRLRTSRRLGTMLSGGLDSSSVAAVACDLLPSDNILRTYSAVFDDAPDSDEREFIDSLVRSEGFDPTYVFMDDIGYLENSDEFMPYLDGIPSNAAFFIPWELAKQAREDDVGVMLTGIYGDVAVSYGFESLPQLFSDLEWLKLYRELASMKEVFGRSVAGSFSRHVLPYITPPVIDRLSTLLRGELSAETDSLPLMNTEFTDRIGLDNRLESTNPSATKWDPIRQHYHSVTSPMLTAALEIMDLTFAAHGLQPRHPFTDIRLIEFLLATPPRQQLRDGMTRSLVRRALSHHLPEPIRTRPWKTVMDQGIVRSMLPERDRLDTILDSPGPLDKYLNLQRVRTATEELDSGEISVENKSVLSNTLWLDAWLRKHRADYRQEKE